LQAVLDFLFEAGTLRNILRAHRQRLGITADNIADHSFRVALTGYFLGQAEGADLAKVLTMCLFHDITDTRTGDHNWVQKSYVATDEARAQADQLKRVLASDALLRILKEYAIGRSLEARVAKDADVLEEMLTLREYELMGSTEASRWLATENRPDALQTETAKALAGRIRSADPQAWVAGIYPRSSR
jgi:putative hydrolase of HD superfamily